MVYESELTQESNITDIPHIFIYVYVYLHFQRDPYQEPLS